MAIRLHSPILTLQRKAPWSWLLLINLAWFAMIYSLFVASTGLPLTLLKFTDDSRLIAFVTSVGGLMGIIIGPMVNFISDRLWTRFGRRRPFLLVAACGTFSAMALLPYIPSLVPLILLVVISSLLGDVGSTFEPLWLEIIPPEQRGAGYAIRNIMVQLASLYFFQVMFAQWDNHYRIALPWGGVLHATGEQAAYAAAAILQLYVIAFLVFLVREVHPGHADLKPWRQLEWNPARFAISFVRNVFGERRWWPVYVFYVAPVFMTAGLGPFPNLMQVEQWKYDKGAMALMGLPPMLVGIFLVAPILGRQADTFRQYGRGLLLGLLACSLAVIATVVYFTYGRLGASDLPPIWAMMVLGVAFGVLGIALVLLLTQELNRKNPSRNPRLWPWLLGSLLTYLTYIGQLLYIRVYLQGSPPPVSHWYLVTLAISTITGFSYLAGPLLYEYLPADKIGTLSSGFGLLSTAVSAFLANAFGFWIFYFTEFFSPPGSPRDYSSYLIGVMITGAISLLLMLGIFRHASNGGITEYGKLRLNSDGTPLTTDD